MLNERCSGICGGTSYGQASNSSLAWKKMDVFKINDDDDDEHNLDIDISNLLISKFKHRPHSPHSTPS